MNKIKKEKLEKAGWKVGTVREFLNLSKEEEEFIELKLTLSKNLEKIRKQKSITQIQLAKMINSSQSRVAKMEKGEASVSLDLIIKTLFTLGTDRKKLAKFVSPVNA